MSMSDLEKLAMMKALEPDPAQLRESALKWLERRQHTLLDQWPQEYRDLSMPTELVKVDAIEMAEFWGHDPMPTPFAKELAKRLDGIMGWDRKFVRLNSRSPKDGCWPAEIPLTRSGKEAVSFISASERCLDDVCRFARIPEQPLYVCLRKQAYGLRPELEFRCFVKERDLIAVTAYDYATNSVEKPNDDGAFLRRLIDEFFSEKIKQSLPSNDLVFDVWLDGKMLRLVEINPYGLSDPCFFQSYENVEKASSHIQYERAPSPCVGEG